MTRARLDNTDQSTLGIAQAGKTVTIYEMDGTTLLAQTLYDAPSGGNVLSNPLTTNSLGQVEAYAAIGQSVKVKPQGGSLRTSAFYWDQGDVATIGGTQTLTGSKLEYLETPLVDRLTGLPAGYDTIGISAGGAVANGPMLSRHPQVNIQQTGAFGSADGKITGTNLWLQARRVGRIVQTLATSTGSNTSTTLNDTGKSWTPNAFQDCQIDIVAGTGSGQTKFIASNTGTRITITGTWSLGTPDATSTYVINEGGSHATQGFVVVGSDESSAKPFNADHLMLGSTVKMMGAGISNAQLFGDVTIIQMGGLGNNGVGREIDLVNVTGAAAGTFPAGPSRVGIALNIASFGQDYFSTTLTPSPGSLNNSLGILFQSGGANDALLTGTYYLRNSIKTYVNDYSDLAAGTTTPKVDLVGLTQVFLAGIDSGAAVRDLIRWASDTLHLQGATVDVNDTAGTNRFRISSTGLSVSNSVLGLRFKANYSHGTVANRLLFQANQANQPTFVGALPDGSGGASAFVGYGGPDPDNATVMNMYVSGTTEVGLEATKNGTGTYTPLVFKTTATQRLQVSANGDIVPGTAALATNATGPFMYVETCAGTPTGTPTTYTGRCAMVFDTTNNKFYVYDGGWIGVTLS